MFLFSSSTVRSAFPRYSRNSTKGTTQRLKSSCSAAAVLLAHHPPARRALRTHSSSLSILSGCHERSAAGVVSGIHFGLVLQQHPEPRDIVREGSGVKWGPGGATGE